MLAPVGWSWVQPLLAAALRAAAPQPVAISGANLAEECQFPTVGSFRAGELCTASVVHPRVVVTAAHCIADGAPSTIHFGETHNPHERKIDVERCEADPEFATSSTSAAHDLAYCVLADAIEGMPTIPLLAGCEVDQLQPGLVAVIAGYGKPDDGGNFGRKRYAFTTLASGLRDDGTVLVGDAGANGCDGDSGGPALVRLSDGSWRVVGVLSLGPGCGKGPDTYRVLVDRIGWLEERSGFDLSPCYDDAAAWEPSSSCDAFADDPRVASAGWEAFCDGPRITPQMTCATSGDDASSSAGEASSSTGEPGGSSSSGAAIAMPPDASCGCSGAGGTAPLIAWVLAVARRRPTRRARSRGARAPR
jgi:uncharacterized protein (TIGR03382 family)